MLQIVVQAKDLAEMAQAVMRLANEMNPKQVDTAHEEKPAKAKKATKQPEPEVTEQEEFDLGDDEETVEEEPTITQKDIISAFKTYAEENSREKAAKILGKFKVKSVKDLTASQYPEVLKALGA